MMGTAILEITPCLRTPDGTPVKFGPVRYTVDTEKVLGMQSVSEAYILVPYQQELRGYPPYASSFLSFELRIFDGDRPQPETVVVSPGPNVDSVSVYNAGFADGRIAEKASVKLEATPLPTDDKLKAVLNAFYGKEIREGSNVD